MFNSSIAFLAGMNPLADAVVITGDQTPHDVWDQSQEGILSTLAAVADHFSLLPASLRMLPTAAHPVIFISRL